jgi:hypothetical protein
MYLPACSYEPSGTSMPVVPGLSGRIDAIINE